MGQQNTIVANKNMTKSDFSMASILLNKSKEKGYKIEVDEEKDKNPSMRRAITNQDKRHNLKQPLICRLENHNVPATTITTTSIKSHNGFQKKNILSSEKTFSHSQQIEHHRSQSNRRFPQKTQQQSLRHNNFVRMVFS